MKVGLYVGTFDLFHAGHVLAMKEAKSKCDKLIVGLNCNPENKTPVQSVYERWVQVAACKYCDELIAYNNDGDLFNVITGLDFDIYFCGDDHKYNLLYDKTLQVLGKDIVYLKRDHCFSSSELKERVVANL